VKAFLWVLLTSLSGAIGAELVAWSGFAQRALLRRAANGLPPQHRERYFEEWVAELSEVPNGPVTRCIWVLSILLHRRGIARALGAPALNPWARKAQRGLDLLVATTAILLLLPTFLVISLAIRLSIGGPAIFRQIRVGLDGQFFTMVKFRSLTLPNGMTWATDVDNHLGHFGRFLRRTSLDELPQLFNVLRGDMSLVDPLWRWLKDSRRSTQST
jgi:hypothetical protein